MARQLLNFGTAPTGVGGDTVPTAASKLQANDIEVYAQLGADAEGNLPSALPINKGGTGATDAAGARSNLGLGTAATRAVGTGWGQLTEVGAFGLGGNINVISGSQSHLEELTAIGEATKFAFSASNYGNKPCGPYSLGINLFSHGDQVFVGFDIDAKKSGMICKSSGGTVLTSTFYTTANATVDSNGFIKAASPIVQLFFDRAELNSEALQQVIEFEKLAIGDYLLKGSTGFAQQGWYIETPKDANGNVLFSVIYDTLDEGEISIKTYKKKFDLETASIVADLTSPVDIPEGRWITIRLQELPQPEFVPPVTNTPAVFQPTGIAKAVSEMMNGTEQ